MVQRGRYHHDLASQRHLPPLEKEIIDLDCEGFVPARASSPETGVEKQHPSSPTTRHTRFSRGIRARSASVSPSHERSPIPQTVVTNPRQCRRKIEDSESEDNAPQLATPKRRNVSPVPLVAGRRRSPIPRRAAGRRGPHSSQDAFRPPSPPLHPTNTSFAASLSSSRPSAAAGRRTPVQTKSHNPPTERETIINWGRETHQKANSLTWAPGTFKSFDCRVCPKVHCLREDNFVKHVREKAHRSAFFRLNQRVCHKCPFKVFGAHKQRVQHLRSAEHLKNCHKF